MNPELSETVDLESDVTGAGRAPGDLACWGAAGLASFLLLSGAVLCWRRLAGHLAAPLGPGGLVLVGSALAATAAASRLAWSYRSKQRRAGPAAPVGSVALSLAVLTAGAALSLPGTSPAGLAILWGILALEECWAWGRAAWRRRFGRRAKTAPRSESRAAAVDSPSAPLLPAGSVLHQQPADDVTQQLTRSRTAEGAEILSGWVRVEMAAHQRSANVHLAFCPPFARAPRIVVKRVEGPEARIKTVQVLPYGARFDVKLVALSETPGTLLLEFLAKSAPMAGDASTG